MRLAADLNNMSWRVRPEEVLLEIGKPFSSRLALQRSLEERIPMVPYSFSTAIADEAL